MERDARIEPHTSPNSTWVIVVEGGGWVLVGDEKTRIAAGEAALWPAGQIHGAWTEHAPLRAFMVELAGADDSTMRGILEGVASVPHPALPPAPRGEGQLAPPNRPAQRDREAGEPL
jgi:gentisate 1,2-dioxygenase